MRRNVIMNWDVSSYFGWGVYGLNLALAWANDPEVALIASQPIRMENLALDPVRLRALAPFLAESAKFQRQLEAFKGGEAKAQTPLLAAVDSAFRPVRTPEQAELSGTPTIGVTFFETAQLTAEAVANAKALPLVIAGSRWNEQVLRAYGVDNVRTIVQGVDPTLFHPAPRVRHAGDRFLVFSGGKLERRKGQDIVVAAFRKFVARRPDAVLVAAWHSPWPAVARSLDRTGLAAPVVFRPEGGLDAAAWAAANGIRPQNFLDAGLTPHPLIPPLLGQMDVALFPNRCEGGTNLMAMECMACGVPVILSANTGHLDLIEEDNCFALTSQGELADPIAQPYGDTRGWGESDVDEAVELLERAYLDREAARRRGERAAATLSRLTWAATAEAVKRATLELCSAQGA
jgi:glycosyltransferase involved in cell wall biosynthesis